MHPKMTLRSIPRNRDHQQPLLCRFKETFFVPAADERSPHERRRRRHLACIDGGTRVEQDLHGRCAAAAHLLQPISSARSHPRAGLAGILSAPRTWQGMSDVVNAQTTDGRVGMRGDGAMQCSPAHAVGRVDSGAGLERGL